MKPLHVVFYYLNLPVAPLDLRSSVKVTSTVFIGAILSLQLWWLRSNARIAKCLAAIGLTTDQNTFGEARQHLCEEHEGIFLVEAKCMRGNTHDLTKLRRNVR